MGCLIIDANFFSMRTPMFLPVIIGAIKSLKKPEPAGYLTGSRVRFLSIFTIDPMAIPVEKSVFESRFVTPIRLLEFVLIP